MAIQLSSRYGKHSVPLNETVLAELERTVKDFLADEQVKMALQHPKILANRRFQETYFAPVPAHLKRNYYEKNQRFGPYDEGTYGHWICLLEFLFRLTSKEVIFNAQGWDTYSERFFALSPMMEVLNFLKSGLLPDAGPERRQHHWAGEPCLDGIDAQVGKAGKRVRVLLAQSCALATFKDGWGVRPGIRREMHRFAAAMHIVVESANVRMPESKRRRGYAHQYALPELVSLNAREKDRDDVIRRKIEGPDWSFRRLALLMRRQTNALLGESMQGCTQVTVLTDATDPVRDEQEIQFALQSMGKPILLGKMNYHNVKDDSSVSLPVYQALTSTALHKALTAGAEGNRAVDAIVTVALSAHDADAHRYWEAKQYSATAGSGWKPGENCAHGQWF